MELEYAVEANVENTSLALQHQTEEEKKEMALKDLSVFLRYCMDEHVLDWSFKQFGERANTDRNYLQKIVSGKRAPSEAVLKNIASALEVPTSFLYAILFSEITPEKAIELWSSGHVKKYDGLPVTEDVIVLPGILSAEAKRVARLMINGLVDAKRNEINQQIAKKIKDELEGKSK